MKKILLIFIIIFGLYLPWVVNAEELKLDWQKNLGGTGQDLYNSIAFLSNGDLIAVGDYYSTDIEGIINNGKSDTIIVKYDKDGNVVWKKTQGGNMYDSFVEVTITKEDEIVIIGDSGSSNFFENKNGKDAIIAKYDKNGNVIWQKSWGTNGTRFTNVTMDDENIIALAIFHKACEGLQNNGNDDIAIIKYDKDGNVIWQKSWGGSGAEEFSAITIDGNKNIIIAGQTYSNDIDGIEKKGNNDIVIIKYNENGNELWKKTWGGNSVESVSDVIVTPQNEIIFVGYTSSNDIENITRNKGNDAIIVKLDENGNVIWQKSLSGNSEDRFSNLALDKDNEIFVAGFTRSSDIDGILNETGTKTMIIKYDKDGNILYKKTYGGNHASYLTNMAVIEGKQIAIGGYSSSTNLEGITNNGYTDMMIAKYSILYNIQMKETTNGRIGIQNKMTRCVIVPSPDKGYEVDEIIIKDANGDILDVEVTALEDGTYSFPLYTDVSVEVLFKEVLSNPKTGVFDHISFILVGLLICIIGYVSINQYNRRSEL